MKSKLILVALLFTYVACRKDKPLPIVKDDTTSITHSVFFTGTWKVVSAELDNHTFIDSFNISGIQSQYDFNCQEYFNAFQMSKLRNAKIIFDSALKGRFAFYDSTDVIFYSPVITNCIPLTYTSGLP